MPLAQIESGFGRLITAGNHPTPDQHGTGDRIGLLLDAGGTIWGLPLAVENGRRSARLCSGRASPCCCDRYLSDGRYGLGRDQPANGVARRDGQTGTPSERHGW